MLIGVGYAAALMGACAHVKPPEQGGAGPHGKLEGTYVAALAEAGRAIWQEYRQVKGSRQKEILAQLEALKWKPYHEISGPG